MDGLRYTARAPRRDCAGGTALPDALWQGDVCHGPTLVFGGKRTPIRIHGLLDDCSRYLVDLEAHAAEREDDMLGVLVGLRAEPFSKEIGDSDLWLPSSKVDVVDGLLAACEARPSVRVVERSELDIVAARLFRRGGPAAEVDRPRQLAMAPARDRWQADHARAGVSSVPQGYASTAPGALWYKSAWFQ